MKIILKVILSSAILSISLPVYSFSIGDFNANDLFCSTSDQDKSLVDGWKKEDQKRTKGHEHNANSTRNQLKASSEALIQANTAIANYQLQQQLQQKVNEQAHHLEQPSTICSTYQKVGFYGELKQSNEKATRKHTIETLTERLDDKSLSQRIARAFVNKNKAFCSENLKAKGMCEHVVSHELQDADINANLLFGGEEDTNRLEDQEVAIKALVNNITGINYALVAVDSHTRVEANAFGGRRSYDMLRRRYNAILNLSTDSLYNIAFGHSLNPDSVIINKANNSEG